jgi:hypothetical protein
VKNTPYIINTSCFPGHKQPEVQKKYFEMMQKYPDDPELAEHVVPVAVTDGKDRIITMDIFKVKQGKFEEVLTRIHSAMAMFLSIEGFAYLIRTWFTIEEAWPR